MKDYFLKDGYTLLETGNGQEALACFQYDEVHLRDGTKFGLTHIWRRSLRRAVGALVWVRFQKNRGFFGSVSNEEQSNHKKEIPGVNRGFFSEAYAVHKSLSKYLGLLWCKYPFLCGHDSK